MNAAGVFRKNKDENLKIALISDVCALAESPPTNDKTFFSVFFLRPGNNRKSKYFVGRASGGREWVRRKLSVQKFTSKFIQSLFKQFYEFEMRKRRVKGAASRG